APPRELEGEAAGPGHGGRRRAGGDRPPGVHRGREGPGDEGDLHPGAGQGAGRRGRQGRRPEAARGDGQGGRGRLRDRRPRLQGRPDRGLDGREGGRGGAEDDPGGRGGQTGPGRRGDGPRRQEGEALQLQGQGGRARHLGGVVRAVQ